MSDLVNIRLAGIEPNDTANGEGVCVSVFLQGCPHHCPGCHNPETWDFDGGEKYVIDDAIAGILKLIRANDIQRNLSILGGEPLCPENIEFTELLAAAAKKQYPNIKIFCWTGYVLEELDENKLINIDVLIDGPYQAENRDITLPLRGSSNQRVLYNGIDFNKKK